MYRPSHAILQVSRRTRGRLCFRTPEHHKHGNHNGRFLDAKPSLTVRWCHHVCGRAGSRQQVCCANSKKSDRIRSARTCACRKSHSAVFTNVTLLHCAQNLPQYQFARDKVEIRVSAWRVHATAWQLYLHAKDDKTAEANRERAAACILKIANSFARDEPLRASFFSAPPIVRVLDASANKRAVS